MKKLTRLTLGLFFGIFAGSAIANTEVTQNETIAVEQTTTTATEKSISTAVNPVNLLNINTASVAEIQDKLIGIGAKKAQAIVDYRTKNGTFSSIEQLTDVSGIGKATLEKNRDRIVLQ